MDINYVDDFAAFDADLSGLMDNTMDNTIDELGSLLPNLQNNSDVHTSTAYQNNTTERFEPVWTSLRNDQGPQHNANFQNNASLPDQMPPMHDSWGTLIGLDIEEPLPPPELIDELNQIYFATVHRTVPMIHRPRYLMAMTNTSPKLRPPVALQYIIWAFAASVTEKYTSVARHYYERARYYFERDEMRGQGEYIISVQHVQALVLIASFEFRSLMFPRAWQSTGKASRLALMLGLHRVEGVGMDVKQCLLPPKDWIEREERRRAFWSCFTCDRYASIGTGWPMIIDEADVSRVYRGRFCSALT